MLTLNWGGGPAARTNAFSSDPVNGRRVATAHEDVEWDEGFEPRLEDYVVQIWDNASGAVIAILAGHSRPVCEVSFSPNGLSLLSISQDGLMKIWDTSSWLETVLLGVEEGEWQPVFRKACFSPDGNYVATGESPHGRVWLWRVDDGSCAAMFTEHTTSIRHIAFTPDGKFLASGDRDGVVVIHRLF